MIWWSIVSKTDHEELEAVFGVSGAPLGLGQVLQSSVEDIEVDNVLDLLKVEKGSLGRKGKSKKIVRIATSTKGTRLSQKTEKIL